MKNCKTFLVLNIIIVAFLTFSCSRVNPPTLDFIPYITAYTGGLIDSESSIKIEFTNDFQNIEYGKEVKQHLFKFSPSVKGKCYWVNSRMIEFVPEPGELKKGKEYHVTFNLGKIMTVKNKLKKFRFSFLVKEYNFSEQNGNIIITEDNPDVVTYESELLFSEPTEIEIVQKMITAKIDNQNIKVIVRPSETPNGFIYTIADIPKKEKEQLLTISINGKVAKIDNKIESEITIPMINDFDLISATAIQMPQSGIKLTFTEPISSLQDLNGLIEIQDYYYNDLIFQINENEIIIFYESNEESLSIDIDSHLQSSKEHVLGKDISIDVPLKIIGPKVEFLSDGNILPNSKNLLLPFRSIALQAVDLEIVKIYESNVLMFLQSNNLSETSEIKRAGRLIYKKTLFLNAANCSEWYNYSIDLEKIIKQEQGAIYQIRLKFNQSYAMAPFNGNAKMDPDKIDEMIKITDGTISEDDIQNWDCQGYYGLSYYNDDYDEYSWEDYEWSEQNNPYHVSYYLNQSNSLISTNVIASNIGLIAKANDSYNYWFFVTDILKAQPLGGATVTLYDAQMQPIGNRKSDKEGYVNIKTDHSAVFAVASLKKEKTYLRLVAGENNSMSRFDVSGSEIQKGLKGFIYGERGIWRPGDTLYLSFMLEDAENKIPDNHPVTLEIYNPRGQFAHKEISTKGINGLYTFSVPTDADAPTGTWNAYVKIGSSSFYKALRIENIKPNRLKIDINFPEEKIYANKSEIPITIKSSWLTGAIARNLDTKVEVSLYNKETTFKGYEKYIFNNPAIEFNHETKEIFEGKLNESGTVSFNLENAFSQNAGGEIKALFTCRVFEAGGDASIHTKSVTISPFDRYVGINTHIDKENPTLETDKDYHFDIVTLDAKGKPVNVNNLSYQIYKMEWSWWWENAQDKFSSYINSNSISPVKEGTLKTVGGKAKIDFNIKSPEWGRYLIYVTDREGGHATGDVVFVDYPSWDGRSGNESPDALKMLAFTINKSHFEAGEIVTVTIPESKTGKALITLENGKNVLKKEWITLKSEGFTQYSFKATPEMAPNVYVHICLLQPHQQVVNDLPIRLYGVKPIFVVDKKTILKPIITVPNVVRPETPFTIKVKEEKGQKMTYTLAIVDEGLLNLTNFKTPDPWNYFYSREALGIKTWDMFDNVIGSFTGEYGSLFSIGGDEGGNRNKNNKSRFKPIVKFIGPFTLEKGESKNHQIKLPQYMGSVRVMVVACNEKSYGNAEKTISVRAPLMLLSTLPRIISTDETIELPVNIFAMEKEIKNVTISVESNSFVKVIGEKSKSVKFSQTGDKMVYFKIKTTHKTGNAKITIKASGNGNSTKESIEIQVRNPNPILVKTENKILAVGEMATFPYYFAEQSPNNQLELEVSRIPTLDFGRRMNFLTNYDHYCTEQITSKALPLLFINQIQDKNKENSKKAQSDVNEALTKLYGRQLSNGSFCYWSDERYANPWVTTYVGHFMLLAKEKGYSVNMSILNKWISYQKKKAQSWTKNESGGSQYESDLSQAYRLYSLALANSPESGAMNRLKERTDLSTQAKWYLAASFALSGKTKIANEIIFNVPKDITVSSSYSTFGSSLRDEAIILDVLVLLNKEKEAFLQARKISDLLIKEHSFSTQSTAFAMMAMSNFADKQSGSLNFSWSNNNNKENVKSLKTMFKQNIPIQLTNGEISVVNNGNGILYANLVYKTFPLKDTTPAKSSNLKIAVSYKDMAGKAVDIHNLTKGTDLNVTITVTNTSGHLDLNDIALTHIIPSGWEIYNERFIRENEDETVENKFRYQDIRDDRIITYFDLKRGKSIEITTRTQVSYAGEFILPAITCEAMYDNSSYAKTKADRITIK